MSHEMGGGRRGATLVCAERIDAETLSAWRDGLLPEDRARWLAAHTPGCPACGARLADYNYIRAALREQRIPRSGSDPWPAMRTLIVRDPRGGRRRPRRQRAMTTWGGAGALVAAAVVIALFAGLLLRQAGVRSKPGAASVSTPTLTTQPAATATAAPAGEWTSVADLTQAPGGAPASLLTQYQVFAGQTAKGTPPVFTLRRSDDGGKTWRDLTPPPVPGGANGNTINYANGFESPLNPKIFILTVQMSRTTGCAQQGNPGGAVSNPCQQQYVTADGGMTWSKVTPPSVGLIALAPLTAGNQPPDALAVQGQRLYGAVSDVQLEASGIVPPGRLVVSDDAGLTWRTADAALAAKSLFVYDYAVTPEGSTIFALAGATDTTLSPGQQPTLTLWRSDDAGATWAPVGPLPGKYTAGLLAANDASGHITLYASVGMPDGSLRVYASTDGGATWPNSIAVPGGGVLLSALPGGAALIDNNLKLESWNSGQPSATPVAQTWPSLSLASETVQRLADGQIRVWRADNSTSTIAWSVVTITA